MVYRSQLLHRRFLCIKVSKDSHNRHHKLPVKQVTKTNFADSIDQFKNQIRDADFVGVSLQKTGSYSAPWHRVLPVDTAETAYLKAKYAAERFQILQFAVCPFSVRDTKLVAQPYNFHLFPRDELRIGMPSYSFMCQSSYLTSMAREGFDFNICINDGISYLSRAQEFAVKDRIGSPVPSNNTIQSSCTPPSVADAVFLERIKSRVKHWRNALKDSGTRTQDALLESLRKLIVGSEKYGSRPSLSIDVCNERQVQLVLQRLAEFADDLVPLLVPAKGGGTQAVRVVLTSSKEDRALLERELVNRKEEENRRVCGFREVIDSISASQKPVVAHNSLNDFAFIHSKFLAPLPPSLDEFRCSLRLVFPRVLDVNHLMKEIGPLKKVTNLHAAAAYLKKRFFVPIDVEIPHTPTQNTPVLFPQDEASEGTIHGYNVLRISQLFAKLCSVLKITPEDVNEGYTNIFSPCSTISEELTDADDVTAWTTGGNTRKVSSTDLVFLWGYRNGTSATMLKDQLRGTHKVFSEEFDVRLVDKSCAIVVFWNNPGSSESFLKAMGTCSESVREIVSEGVRGAGYEAYERVCRLGIWEGSLADSLDKALEEEDTDSFSEARSKVPSDIDWNADLMIDLDDL